jgi:hypothetical protein
MIKLQLPHVILPKEFVTLLKTNLQVTSSPAPIFDVIRPNKAIYLSLERAFAEFDDGRGLEKTMMALGWANFRDRMASMYIYKVVHGNFPTSTSMDLVDDIKTFEHRFVDHGVHGLSRVFLLGFYLKLANLQIRERQNNQFLEIKVPEEIGPLLKLSQGRSERADWLILILLHLHNSLGDKLLTNTLLSGKKFDELYELLTEDQKKNMLENLLAYGASINEADFFLYDRV